MGYRRAETESGERISDRIIAKCMMMKDYDAALDQLKFKLHYRRQRMFDEAFRRILWVPFTFGQANSLPRHGV